VAVQLAKYTRVKILLDVPDEKLPLKITQQIVIGTPGRIFNAVDKNKLNTGGLRIFVLDEADAMLDLQGQREQSTRIKRKIPQSCQICLFSATYNNQVKEFSQQFVPKPHNSVFIEPEKLSVDQLTQTFIDCGTSENRMQVLSDIFACVSVGQTIIFTHTRHAAKSIYEFMINAGHEVSLLHGNDMPPKMRDKVIENFRNGKNRILISTNVLARGIDVLQVSLVINYDIPMTNTYQPDPETYLHRIGRTARYKNPGLAINLVYDSASKTNLQIIQQHFNRPISEMQKTNLDQIGEILDKMLGAYSKH